MQSSSLAVDPVAQRSFASLVAELSLPEDGILPEENAGEADLLSYEHALRARSRGEWHLHAHTAPGSPHTGTGNFPPAGEELRRSSVVTLRLTPAENARLRDRASEAGLTVSAYLRSCAFEVESLRAQVKEALTQLRTGPANADGDLPVVSQPQRRRFAFHWRRRGE